MKRHLILLVFSFCAAALHAQSVPYLNVPADARALALGGATAALPADAFALYHNPAAMAFAPHKAALGLSYGTWQPTAAGNSLFDGAGTFKVGQNLGLGFAGRYFAHPAYDVTDKNGTLTGQFSPKEMDFAVGAAYKVVDFLSIGAGLRYTGSTLAAGSKASALSADLALMARVKGLQLALGLAHLGSKPDYGTGTYDLPSMIRLGAAYPLQMKEAHRLTLSVEARYLLSAASVAAALGLEYAFKDLVFVRAGYHYGDALKAIPSYASVGAGLKFAGISLGGAYLLAGGDSPLKNSLSLSLGFDIAPTR